MAGTPGLVVRYGFFALVAMIANFTVQWALVSMVAAPYGIGVSLLGGTVIGFGVKYLLDKNFIFFDRFNSPADEGVKVVLYGVTAVFTTFIFWSFELGALAVWHNSFAKYTGGAAGLSIGYFTKYLLDRRFVFSGAP